MLAPLELVAWAQTGERSWEGLIRDGGKVYAARMSRIECRCECDGSGAHLSYPDPITPETVCPHLRAIGGLPVYV